MIDFLGVGSGVCPCPLGVYNLKEFFVMKNFKKFALALVAVLGLAFSASAEGTIPAGITSIITETQTTITLIVAAVIVAGGAILGAMVGLRALPWAYRKIVAFFK